MKFKFLLLSMAIALAVGSSARADQGYYPEQPEQGDYEQPQQGQENYEDCVLPYYADQRPEYCYSYGYGDQTQPLDGRQVQGGTGNIQVGDNSTVIIQVDPRGQVRQAVIPQAVDSAEYYIDQFGAPLPYQPLDSRYIYAAAPTGGQIDYAWVCPACGTPAYNSWYGQNSAVYVGGRPFPLYNAYTWGGNRYYVYNRYGRGIPLQQGYYNVARPFPSNWAVTPNTRPPINNNYNPGYVRPGYAPRPGYPVRPYYGPAPGRYQPRPPAVRPAPRPAMRPAPRAAVRPGARPMVRPGSSPVVRRPARVAPRRQAPLPRPGAPRRPVRR